MTLPADFDYARIWPGRWLVEAGPSAYSCLSPLRVGKLGCFASGGASRPMRRLRWRVFRRIGSPKRGGRLNMRLDVAGEIQ